MTWNERKAKEMTVEFRRWMASKVGKRTERPIIQSAAFEERYPKNFSINGWHGQKSRGYGELNVVLDLWKSHINVASWRHAFDVDMTPFSADDLASYEQFLAKLKKLVEVLI